MLNNAFRSLPIFLIPLFAFQAFAFAEHAAKTDHPKEDETGNRVRCEHVTEGEEVGGKFVTKASFNSVGPALSEVTSIKLTGQPVDEQKTTYLSAKSVCGLELDFARDCKAEEKIDAKFGYTFSFTCGTQITAAELYCDENCFSDSSLLTFKCEGPKVDKKLGKLSFLGCKFTKATVKK